MTTPELAACPDCDADVALSEDGPGQFTVVVVSHDGCCPWFSPFVCSGADRVRLYTKDQP